MLIAAPAARGQRAKINLNRSSVDHVNRRDRSGNLNMDMVNMGILNSPKFAAAVIGFAFASTYFLWRFLLTGQARLGVIRNKSDNPGSYWLIVGATAVLMSLAWSWIILQIYRGIYF
jgi:hypothetical protein